MNAQSDQWDESTRGKKMSDATGRVIYKYQMPVIEQFTMKLPKGAEIIRVADQDGMFWLWAVVRTDVEDEERKFWAFKTGGKIPDGLNLRYVGFCAVFVQMELGLYLFEEVPPSSCPEIVVNVISGPAALDFRVPPVRGI